MRWLSIALGVGGLIILSCFPAVARTSRGAHGGNCVAYAREVTGVHLDGNAAQWWPHAEGRYDRGHQPAVGAILVFKAYGRMRVGHVAVVSRLVGPREILIDHANWVRGRVTKAMSVVDASPNNDWTVVKVLEPRSGTHGRDNPTYGFIYTGTVPSGFDQVITDADLGSPKRHHIARSEERRAHRAVARLAKAGTAELVDDAPQPRVKARHVKTTTDELIDDAPRPRAKARHHANPDEFTGDEPRSQAKARHAKLATDELVGDESQTRRAAERQSARRHKPPPAQLVAVY